MCVYVRVHLRLAAVEGHLLQCQRHAHWFYTCKSVHLSERISINIYKHCNVAYKGGAPQNTASPDDITLMSLFKICTFYEKSELLLMKSMFIVNLTYSRE